MDTKDLKPLSPKERQVLEAAEQLRRELGTAPSYKQLREALGVDGTTHVYNRVDSIRAKGYTIPVLPPFSGYENHARLTEISALVRQWREDPTIEPADVLTLIAEILEPEQL